MENFEFYVPTKIMFGRGQLDNLPKVINEYGTRVLLVYGGESIKKLGIYDQINQSLDNCEIIELSGIAPNSRIDQVRTGVSLCRDKKVDVILAVGGGSVIDTAKAIAAGYYYDGDAWDMIASQTSGP